MTASSDRRFRLCSCRIRPQLVGSDEGVQDRDEFSHRGGERDLFEFSIRREESTGTQHLVDTAWNFDRILWQVLKVEWLEGAMKGLEIWLGWHGWKCLRRMRLRSCM